jgi:hypothetical protein
VDYTRQAFSNLDSKGGFNETQTIWMFAQGTSRTDAVKTNKAGKAFPALRYVK